MSEVKLYIYSDTKGDGIGLNKSGSLTTKEVTVKQYDPVSDKDGNLTYQIDTTTTTYEVKASLEKLDFVKKLYEPGTINATLSVTAISTTSQLDVQKNIFYPNGSFKETKVEDPVTTPQTSQTLSGENIKTAFLNEKVELTVDGHVVATNFFVFVVRSNHKKDSSSSVTVKLTIFSEDKKLTLEKYSKAFTAKRLGNDIFKGEIKNFGNPAYNVNLQVLSYGTNKESELRQPYLVQYNESFYNFMKRTANRCGEFLYFENGKLNLGVTLNRLDQVTTGSAVDYSTLAQEYSYESLYGKDDESDVEDYNYNYLNNKTRKSAHHAEKGKLHYSDPLSADEYLDLIDKEYTNWKEEKDFRKSIMAHLFNILSGTSLSQLLVNTAFTVIERNYEIGKECMRLNDEHKEENIDDWEGEACTDQWNGEQLSQFGTGDSQSSDISNSTINMNADFYSLVRQAEKKVGKEALIMKFGDKFQDLKLGDVINVDGASYLIIQVNGRYMYKAPDDNSGTDSGSDANSTNNSDTDNGSGTDTGGDTGNDPATLTSTFFGTNLGTDSGTTSGTTSSTIAQQNIVAIPLYEVKDSSTTKCIPIPPALPKVCVRESQPQLAFVTCAVDPKKIGRLRIRYAWQEEDGDASPWVRVSLPFATDGGGIKFMPEEDDEVLVSFEEGNVERPYVSGYLLSERSNQSWCYLPERTIVSKNGHGIVFNDVPNSRAFFTNLVPVVGYINSLIPETRTLIPEFAENTALVADLAGGMTISDRYGLYQIDMSSDARSINIQSAMGNVELNAFTGITISAPNGDIKIEGKNVEISASNRVDITSGKALEERYVSKGLSFFEGAKDAFKEEFLDKLIDMTLLRTCVEVIIRPIDGTTHIKSYTFLQIEAGKGSAEIPPFAYKHPDAAPKKLFTTLVDICTSIDSQVEVIDEAFKTLKTKFDEFAKISGDGVDLANHNSSVIALATVIDKAKNNSDIEVGDYHWDQNNLELETFNEADAIKRVKNETGFNERPKLEDKDKHQRPYKNDVTSEPTRQYLIDTGLWDDLFRTYVTVPERAVITRNNTKQAKRSQLTKCVYELYDQYIKVQKMIKNLPTNFIFVGAEKKTYSSQAKDALKKCMEDIPADDNQTIAGFKAQQVTINTGANIVDIDKTAIKQKWKRRALIVFLIKLKDDFNNELGVQDAIDVLPILDNAATSNYENATAWSNVVGAALKEDMTPAVAPQPNTKIDKIKGKAKSFFKKIWNSPVKDWFKTNYFDPWVDATYNRRRWASGSDGKILLSDSASKTLHINEDGTIESTNNMVGSSKYIRDIKKYLNTI